eukprot:CAMPEP_0113911350 /NCGR_PEP_ID=MMETSP0780_2-20120614/28150_1 /TAXON_ID=652834 /ORGANISM="Palpitomonas bilix" /LENGTH=761 /DNA_ID=CAMNT_0000907843 /DNA_START=56 /DNA_END=2339 /DNA_ORIENTATION=- /assembly_acc=CAM_ASM_000599
MAEPTRLPSVPEHGDAVEGGGTGEGGRGGDVRPPPLATPTPRSGTASPTEGSVELSATTVKRNMADVTAAADTPLRTMSFKKRRFDSAELGEKVTPPEYDRLVVDFADDDIVTDDNCADVSKKLLAAVALRAKYVPEQQEEWNMHSSSYVERKHSIQNSKELDVQTPASTYVVRMIQGVARVYANEDDAKKAMQLYADMTKKGDETEVDSEDPTIAGVFGHSAPSFSTYFKDLTHLMKVITDGAVNTTANKRLKMLKYRFDMHCLLNAERENAEQRATSHRDFYNVRKVDTHVHHSACMNQKRLLKYIKRKLKESPDEIVIFRDGKYLTIKEVFESLKLNPQDLSVDNLDTHAHQDTFHRFDKFNLKYNPFGQSRLREVFLKTDNLIGGKFLAEMTHEVFADLKQSKYQLAEYRISIYGRKRTEWDKLAAWACNHSLFVDENRWMIQIPRLYAIYKRAGVVENFQDMLDNIFLPLFECTIDPLSRPQLHRFLLNVSGFDSVDDESRPEIKLQRELETPEKWVRAENPPYNYYTYYFWANIRALNMLRKERGMNTFTFRPHAGEAGEPDHLASTFLCADAISHGINLRKIPALQYLYYLENIGLAVSPLSNNSLFLRYNRNPFPDFFSRGLNVSLSTDDPLMLHFTKEPLMEEYSVAAQVYCLSRADLCEIARNSVIQSGFEHELKVKWIGDYHKPGVEGNSTSLTNVPLIRTQFRMESRWAEFSFLLSHAHPDVYGGGGKGGIKHELLRAASLSSLLTIDG